MKTVNSFSKTLEWFRGLFKKTERNVRRFNIAVEPKSNDS